MQITLCAQNDFIIYIDKNELAGYGLDFTVLDYKNNPTRQFIADVAFECRERFDVPPRYKKLSVKAYNRAGGVKLRVRFEPVRESYIFAFNDLSALYELAERCGNRVEEAAHTSLLYKGDDFYLAVYPKNAYYDPLLSLLSEFGERTEPDETPDILKTVISDSVMSRLLPAKSSL